MHADFTIVSHAGVCWLFGVGLVLGVAAARILEEKGYEFYFKWPWKISLRKKE